MHPAISILITLISLGIINAFAAWGMSAKKLSAETARKTVHVGMGLVCLTFPWLFNSVFPVQLLAGIAIITLIIVRTTKLKQTVGSSLFSVNRLSIGELLFPFAVAWLFTLSWDKPLLYTISLLLLTLADTAGALAGSKFGKKKYSTTAATKSIEGSIAFFLTACCCIAIPLYFLSDTPLTLILFLTLTVSLFTAAVEGASGHGVDNLLIPIGSFLLLDYYIHLSSHLILARSIVLIILLAILVTTHRKHSFDGGAVLSGMLFGFAAFTLGSIFCLLAVVIIFTRHTIIHHAMPKKYTVTHSVDAIISISIPSLFWLTLGRGEIIEQDIAQFGCIATLSLIIGMLHTGTQKHLHKKKPSLFIAFLLSALVLTASLPLEFPLLNYLPTLGLSIVLSWLYFRWRGYTGSASSLRWVKLAVLAFIFSPLAMLPFLS